MLEKSWYLQVIHAILLNELKIPSPPPSLPITMHTQSNQRNLCHTCCPTTCKPPLAAWHLQAYLMMPPFPEVEIKFKWSSAVKNLDEDENKIKAIYEELSRIDLLEHCVQGLTQNVNESCH